MSRRVAADWSFSGGVAICYALPVLWMTSYFHIMHFIARHVHVSLTASRERLTFEKLTESRRFAASTSPDAVLDDGNDDDDDDGGDHQQTDD